MDWQKSKTKDWAEQQRLLAELKTVKKEILDSDSESEELIAKVVDKSLDPLLQHGNCSPTTKVRNAEPPHPPSVPSPAYLGFRKGPKTTDVLLVNCNGNNWGSCLLWGGLHWGQPPSSSPSQKGLENPKP